MTLSGTRCTIFTSQEDLIGGRLGRTATQPSKKGSEKVLGRVVGEGSQKASENSVCIQQKRASEKGSAKVSG